MSKWNNLKSGNLLKIVVFLIFPVVFLFIALPFNRTRYSNDPEYAYLMNGINIGMFKSVGHTDNPGTSVQVYSAIVLRCLYLVQKDKSDGFQKYVLRNADACIEIERRGLIILNSLVMLLLGVISWVMLRNVWLGLLLQIMPFTSANLTEHIFTKVSPEPVLLMATAALVLLVIRFYILIDRNNKRFAILFALACGFGLATKATFLPLLIIPFLLLDNTMLRKKFLLYTLLFFIFFTIPALPQYPHMAKWFLGLTAHTGTYGEGGLGIISPFQYVNDIISILKNNPVLSITLLIVVLIITEKLIKSSFKPEFKNNIIFRIIVSLATAEFAGVLMVAKHYHANHYLVPELCMEALTLVFVFLFIGIRLPLKFRKVLALIPFVLLLISSGLVVMKRNYLQTANKGYELSNQDYDKTQNLIENDYKGYTLTYYYPTSVNPYSALRWGNVYSKFKNQKTLKEIYPDGYFFDIRNNHFSLWETPVSTGIMADISNRKLLIVGGPFEESEKKKIEQSGLKLTTVYKGYTQIIYKVEFNE